MTLVVTHALALASGILLGASALVWLGKRGGHAATSGGFAGSDDFSWPGRPMVVIEATVEDAARQVGA